MDRVTLNFQRNENGEMMYWRRNDCSAPPHRQLPLPPCHPMSWVFKKEAVPPSHCVSEKPTSTWINVLFWLGKLNEPRITKCWCFLLLCRDAAHVIHPMAGLGLNLGIGDVQCLSSVIEHAVLTGQDIGNVNYLRAYNQQQMLHNLGMMTAIDGLWRIYHSEWSWMKQARVFGVDLLNQIPMAKVYSYKCINAFCQDLTVSTCNSRPLWKWPWVFHSDDWTMFSLESKRVNIHRFKKRNTRII